MSENDTSKPSRRAFLSGAATAGACGGSTGVAAAEVTLCGDGTNGDVTTAPKLCIINLLISYLY